MKTLFLSLFLFASIPFLSGQDLTISYEFPNYPSQYVLDSLKIPYVPIPQRNGTSSVALDYPFKRSISAHIDYFGNDQFDFFPSESTPSIKWEDFSKRFIFLNEYEIFQSSFFSEFGFEVIGYSKIDLEGGKYRSVWIIEERYRTQDKTWYSTSVILENISGNAFFLDHSNYKVPGFN